MKNEKGNAVQFVYEWADKYGSPDDTGKLSDMLVLYGSELETQLSLPNDAECEKWYDKNISNGCSASSAIYKFRLWLKERQEGL